MLKFAYLRYWRNNKLLFTEIKEAVLMVSCTTNRLVAPKLSTSAILLNKLDLEKCFQFVKELTLQAGETFKCKFYGEKDIQTKHEEWDLVTEANYIIEDIYVESLCQKFPDHKIIAEEMLVDVDRLPELTNDPTWFLDSIDGTVNFIHGFPHACISVGLTVCKEPVLGIIYNPVTREMYCAIKNKGAYLNDKRICTSKIRKLKESILITESTLIRYYPEKRDISECRFLRLLDNTRGIRSIGSAAMSLTYLARGAADCVHMDDLKAWDVVAATIIVREAGGCIIDTQGCPYDIMRPNTVAAANETLARDLSNLIIDTDTKTKKKLNSGKINFDT